MILHFLILELTDLDFVLIQAQLGKMYAYSWEGAFLMSGDLRLQFINVLQIVD